MQKFIDIQRSSDGRTALMNACFAGHLDIAMLLISRYNADPSIKDKYGKTAHDDAIGNDHVDCVRYLESLSPGVVSVLCSNGSEISLDLKICAGCKKARYCNEDCQLADWKKGHKDRCKAKAVEKK